MSKSSNRQVALEGRNEPVPSEASIGDAVTDIEAASEYGEGTMMTAEEVLLFMGIEYLRTCAEDAGIEATLPINKIVKKLLAKEGMDRNTIIQEREKAAFHLFARGCPIIPSNEALSELDYRRKQKLAMAYRLRANVNGVSLKNALIKTRKQIIKQYKETLSTYRDEEDELNSSADVESSASRPPRKRQRTAQNQDKGWLPEREHHEHRLRQQEVHLQLEGHPNPESNDPPLVAGNSRPHASWGVDGRDMHFTYPTQYQWTAQAITHGKEWWPEHEDKARGSQREITPQPSQHPESAQYSPPHHLMSKDTKPSSTEGNIVASSAVSTSPELSGLVGISTSLHHVPSTSSSHPHMVLVNAAHRSSGLYASIGANISQLGVEHDPAGISHILRVSSSPEGPSPQQISEQAATDSISTYALRRNPDMWSRGQPSYTTDDSYSNLYSEGDDPVSEGPIIMFPTISREGRLLNPFESHGCYGLAQNQAVDEWDGEEKEEDHREDAFVTSSTFSAKGDSGYDADMDTAISDVRYKSFERGKLVPLSLNESTSGEVEDVSCLRPSTQAPPSSKLPTDSLDDASTSDVIEDVGSLRPVFTRPRTPVFTRPPKGSLNASPSENVRRLPITFPSDWVPVFRRPPKD